MSECILCVYECVNVSMNACEHMCVSGGEAKRRQKLCALSLAPPLPQSFTGGAGPAFLSTAFLPHQGRG